MACPGNLAGKINILGNMQGDIGATGIDETSGNLTSGGRILVVGDLEPSAEIKFQRDIAGEISITGSIHANAGILADRHISGPVAIAGQVDGQILANANAVEDGDITGDVTVSGEFDGNICGDNLYPDECLPENIDIQSFGQDWTVCDQAGCICGLDPPALPSSEGPLAGESYAKNRYISLASANPGQMTAIRVTLIDCAPFPEAEGDQWWLGEPEVFCENSGKVEPPCPEVPVLPNQFMGAKLQCTPYYMDWHGVCEQDLCVGGLKEGESCGTDEDCRGVVHAYGVGTVPSAWTAGQLDPTTYAIQAIHEGCSVGIEDNFSAPLEITMARWGDIVTNCVTCPCGAPDGVLGIPTDVTAVLDKFKNLGPPTIPCAAVMKVRADVDFDCPNRRVDISDVTFVYDAFRWAVEYPPNEEFQGPEGEEWPCP